MMCGQAAHQSVATSRPDPDRSVASGRFWPSCAMAERGEVNPHLRATERGQGCRAHARGRSTTWPAAPLTPAARTCTLSEQARPTRELPPRAPDIARDADRPLRLANPRSSIKVSPGKCNSAIKW
eukprot:scaffold2819_cov128-Isochrysis_galbana.AAC.4